MLRHGVFHLNRWPLLSLIDLWCLKFFQIIPAGDSKRGHLPATVLSSSVTITPALKQKQNTKQLDLGLARASTHSVAPNE